MDEDNSYSNEGMEDSSHLDTSHSSRYSQTSLESGRSQSSVQRSQSSDDPSSTAHTASSNRSDNASFEPESKAVAISRSRMVILVLITIAAATLGAITYFGISNEQVHKFEFEYYEFSTLILNSTSREAKRMFAAVYSFGNTLTTFADSSNLNWPNITLPEFELQGFKNNQLSKAIQITFSPLVTVENREQWEEYAVSSQGWLTQSLEFQEQLSAIANQTQQLAVMAEARRRLEEDSGVVPPIPDHIWSYVDGKPVTEEGDGLDFGPGNYGPVWQQSPAPTTDPSIINYDLLSNPDFASVYKAMWETQLPILSPILDLQFLYGSAVDYNNSTNPTSFLMSPVYPFLSNKRRGLHRDDLSGFLVAVIPWDRFFVGILPTGVDGLVVVMSNTCGDAFTYVLNGPQPVYLGPGDLHDPSFNDMVMTSEFADFMQFNFSDQRICSYTMNIYPSSNLKESYMDSKPGVYTAVVVMLFVFTAMVFVLYNMLVQSRQAKVAETFKRTAAIVASMFPSDFKDRIIRDAEKQAEQESKKKKKRKSKDGMEHAAPKAQLKSFLDEAEEATKLFDSKPIADLFPHTTVCFADLVGFTAWSSVREPSQVFMLLETLYHAFDEIAKRRKVFKVETIGDCYVAVTGLPDPRKDHAVVMCRFARDCIQVMGELTKKLEITLGPDTAELSMRFGLHSGPVTAGVLRGDNCRFQLFGETVNLASRVEQTGARDRIHISQDTADLLIAAGKGHWMEARSEKIKAKGKGEMQTYWLTIGEHPVPSSDNSRSSDGINNDDTTAGGLSDTDANLSDDENGNLYPLDAKTQRLVEWNADVLSRMLRHVVARRLSSESFRAEGLPESNLLPAEKDEGKTVLDEVVEIIHLPEFDVAVAPRIDPQTVELGEVVLQQLQDYVAIIATMYRSNPFHNMEHASHVTMSVVKLLSRIVAPELHENEIGDHHKIASSMHDHTYGITSDPLTQFACVFAALIHDVDHLGVPNTQLVKENAHIAKRYNGKSVAEQNSVDVAWNLLMDDSFRDLRAAIYSNNEEKKRFRQLVVNSVMATDIMDKDLKALRNGRWDKAFKGSTDNESMKDVVDRKATIVIEHLIQASDVAHTMQHWHIFRKWNERLFHEMYTAYKTGRAEKDPAEFWYNGEIGFFDFYIIPLAKKLKDCGVFGVSSDEYLIYAEKNRKEWEAKGQEVVASMLEKYKSQFEVREVLPVKFLGEDDDDQSDYDLVSDLELDEAQDEDVDDDEAAPTKSMESALGRSETSIASSQACSDEESAEPSDPVANETTKNAEDRGPEAEVRGPAAKRKLSVKSMLFL